jgi:hypothetical protein
MLREISWSAEKSGLVHGASVHDGRIINLSIADSGRTKIVIKHHEGSLVELVLDGVSNFGLRSYAHNHVVDRIYAWPLKFAPNQDLSVWDTLYAEDLARENLAKELERLRNTKPNDLLVRIEFAYTSDMAFQCEKLSIFADND